jgi:probable F420-dependent oxidoreductase
MKVDAMLLSPELDTMAERARRMEELGYDGLLTAETQHDPFFPLLLAAGQTERMDLGTCIAVAFPRSPMHLAHIGHDLQGYSKGRFILGLGSQIKAHVEKRFSSTFSHPAARMREVVLATRAIWKCWEEGEPLRFEGRFYRHTLMTPFFNPGPSGYGVPRIFLAAVGQQMTEVVGEVADGMFVHSFTTEKYLREATIPALERGLATSGRSRADVELSLGAFIITGDDDAEWERADQAVRQQIAFYGSTPPYRPVLEAHGWGDLQTELNTLSKRGDWEEMGRRIPDEVVEALAVRGTPAELPALVADRYGEMIDRLAFYSPARPAPEAWADVIEAFKATSSTAS